MKENVINAEYHLSIQSTKLIPIMITLVQLTIGLEFICFHWRISAVFANRYIG